MSLPPPFSRSDRTRNRHRATGDARDLLFAVPAGACDCHVHVFDPAQFPLSASRSYSPGAATCEDLEAFRSGLCLDRLVIVQPSVYGTDNRCLIDALATFGPKIARGVAVIDPATTSDRELRALHEAGVVGVRVNLNSHGGGAEKGAIAAVSEVARRIAGFDFVLQIYVDLALVTALTQTIAGIATPVVLDHFGGARAALGVRQAGFDDLRRLLDGGDIWVKLSAPYRASSHEPDFPDLEPLARSLIASNPERLVWASDWPHTGGGVARKARDVTEVEPFRAVDDANALAVLASWAGDATTFEAILVDNAAKLFRF